MTDAGFEVSNQAVAAIFGSGGFLVAVLTQYIAGKKNKAPTIEGCEKIHKKNDDDHAEFFRRIGSLEGDQKVNAAVVARIDASLKEIKDLIEDLRQ